jgi:hypothetical protein
MRDPGRRPLRNFFSAKRIATYSSCGLILSFGLCGAGAALGTGAAISLLLGFGMPLAILSVVGLFVSLILSLCGDDTEDAE